MPDPIRKQRNQVMAENADLRAALWAVLKAKTLEEAKRCARAELERAAL